MEGAIAHRFSPPSESFMPTVPRYTHLMARTQVLVRTRLDDDLWRRTLRLIRKISQAQGILPSSYILQTDEIRVGELRAEGGFGVVSDGEYQGNIVAIKHIKMSEGDPDKNFKVSCLWLFSQFTVV